MAWIYALSLNFRIRFYYSRDRVWIESLGFAYTRCIPDFSERGKEFQRRHSRFLSLEKIFDNQINPNPLYRQEEKS